MAYGSETITPSQIKMAFDAEEFLLLFLAFKNVAHKILRKPTPVIIKTGSEPVTWFILSKMIHPPLGNACNFVLQVTLPMIPIFVQMNTAAVSWSHLETNLNQKLSLNFQKMFLHNHWTLIQQGKTKSFFPLFTLISLPKNSQCKTYKKSGKNGQMEPQVITVSHCHKIDKYTDTLTYNMEPFNKVPSLINDQDADPVLLNFRKQVLATPRRKNPSNNA